ncbi:MAG: hypothetical protein IPH13_10125 [Planctomycetes bacterium]|nr:hypothetical protein [Planctomycetota bacterium]
MRLELPEQALLERKLIVLVFDVDEVKAPVAAVEWLDCGDDTAPIADRGEHANSWRLDWRG